MVHKSKAHVRPAIIYIRVSSDEQAEKGYSLPSQLEACRKYATEQGFTIVAEITDDYTGSKLDRPGLDQVRAMLEQGEAQALIVYSSDRLTRSLAHSLLLRDELQQWKVELHYCMRGKLEDTPESRMVENIEGVFAEYWRERIIEGSRRGRRTKALSGKWVGIGDPPYGYKRMEGRLEIDEEAADIVRLIYKWYTVGDETGSGPLVDYAIACKVEDMHVPTPAERLGKKRKYNAGTWSYTAVRRILVSETYAGVARYGRLIGEDGKGGKRPEHEQIKIPVPAIVDRDVWEAAQARREYNKKMSKRNAKREYLLRGLITCGCGSKMVGGGYQKTGFFYYYCSYRTKYRHMKESPCQEMPIRCEVLEGQVWDYVCSIITYPQVFEAGLRKAQAAERAVRQPKLEQLRRLDRLIAKCEAEALALVQALKGVEAGGLVSRTIKEKTQVIDGEYKALMGTRERLVQELQTGELTDEDIDAALEFRRDTLAGLENPTDSDKRRMLEYLDVKVSVRGGRVTIGCRISIDMHTSGSARA